MQRKLWYLANLFKPDIYFQASAERSKVTAEEELHEITKEKIVLNEAFNKSVKESQNTKNASVHLEKANKQMTKDLKEKTELIGQLEKVCKHW